MEGLLKIAWILDFRGILDKLSIPFAKVVELVDTQDLGSCALGCESSSLSFRIPMSLQISGKRG